MDDNEFSFSSDDLIQKKPNQEWRKPVEKPVQKKPENEAKNGGLKAFFSKKKNVVIVSILAVILIAGGVIVTLILLNNQPKNSGKTGGNGGSSNNKIEEVVEKFYDNLTGEVVSYSGLQYNADGTPMTKESGEEVYYSVKQAEDMAYSINHHRINCVQIPNGTDARPQVGLSEAKIVYEAIAEGGITRFAAIYRDAKSDVIGPVRSLRTYYLEWDTPYDCTIVHAGGEKNALNRVQSYDHLSESATYMWRDYSAYYAPNNLFTSAKLLESFNNDNNYRKSDPKTFERFTPDESEEAKGKVETKTKDIYIHFTNGSNNYNVTYDYDEKSNSYLRGYEGSSGKHLIYTCKNQSKSGSKIRPQKDCGGQIQVAPKVVAVIKVDEKLNQDNHYREDIVTTGTGEATIFQNGDVIKGTWTKKTDKDQLEFKDEKGKIIKLAPGQTFIEAIAKSYGYVKYE